MSTEIFEKTMAVDLEPLIEFINNECFDIVTDEDNHMDAERYARLVNIIGNRCRFCHRNNVTDFSFKMGVGEHRVEYYVRVNNNYGGFVSVSNETGDTGVSNTFYYPFFSDDEDGYFAGYMSLAQMINEAWYLCTN